ncbi:MAG: inositol monophosphatase family protein [Phycisphaerae bacterium]|nr:inositol monophosphatase family protein [Phycisphaerae bacterium]
MHKPDELESLLEFAVESAQLAGAFTLGFFNAATPHQMKADRTPVTEADRGAEQRLRERITKYFPQHGILGEEFGETPGAAATGARGGGAGRWILDPVDGTYSFICGVPLYATLVAFERDREMLLGVIHLPALHETIYAARGLGCWWNGRRARVSNVATLSDARLCTTGTKNIAKHGREPGFQRLREACYADRAWSDAYAYALVATGRAEIAVDPIMSLWDVAPLYPIIHEAGGRITDWRGEQNPFATDSVATNGAVHADALRLLRAQD